MIKKEDYLSWILQPENNLAEQIQRAINACNSIEIYLSEKYEVTLNWLCDKLQTLTESSGDNFFLLKKLADLTIPGGSVTIDTFKAFLNAWTFELRDCYCSQYLECLNILINNQSLQSFYNTDSIQQTYLSLINQSISIVIRSNHDNFQPSPLDNVLDKILLHLKNYTQRIPNIQNFKVNFDQVTIKSFSEICVLKKRYNANTDILLEIYCKIYFTDEDFNWLENLRGDLHVILLKLDLALAHYRSHTKFLTHFYPSIFSNFCWLEPKLQLSAFSYIFVQLEKYEIQASVQISNDENASKFIGSKIVRIFDLTYDSHFEEVVTLLCRVLKWNPMILEQNIIEITTKCLLFKKGQASYGVYSEFLTLVLDLFKKLSRSEKLLSQLLKSVEGKIIGKAPISTAKRKSCTLPSEELARGIKIKSFSSILITDDTLNYMDILIDTLPSLTDANAVAAVEGSRSFASIESAWPWYKIGLKFSTFISSLMSKPSLVCWKTLVFSLSDALQYLGDGKPRKNVLFLIEFNSALLCQYFRGCRLAEQSDKFFKQINENRELTRKLLVNFGERILSIEHNQRLMSSFLEVACNSGNFDLIFWYYLADSVDENNMNVTKLSKNIHDYLTPEQWNLVEQRIVNFGEQNCKENIHLIHIQYLKAGILLNSISSSEAENCIRKMMSSKEQQCYEIFSQENNQWLVNYFDHNQLSKFAKVCLKSSVILNLPANEEFLGILLIAHYEKFKLSMISEECLVNQMDFQKLYNHNTNSCIEYATNVIKENLVKSPKQALVYDSKLLNEFMSLDSIRKWSSTRYDLLTFNIILAIYLDCKAAKCPQDLMTKLSTEIFESIDRKFHIDLFSYYNIEDFLNVFSPEEFSKFYHSLLSPERLSKSNNAVKNLEKIAKLIKKSTKDQVDNFLTIGNIIFSEIELAKQEIQKKLKPFYQEILNNLLLHIHKWFKEMENSLEYEKEFVVKTLAIYNAHLSTVLGTIKDNENEIDNNFRRICKVYIARSIDLENSSYVKLLNVALQHRKILHFDQDEIEFVLNESWKQFIIIAKRGDHLNADAMLKLISDYKSENDFRKMLFELGTNLDRQTGHSDVLKILREIGAIQLNTVKSAIFIEYFKQILFDVILAHKSKYGIHEELGMKLAIDIIDCLTTICQNKNITLSTQLVDDILTFIMDINLKKKWSLYPKMFFHIFGKITELCLQLIRKRHTIIAERIPQFVYIVKDMLQALCYYKTDQNSVILEENELFELGESAHKTETLVKELVSHSIEVKRLAPYLLIFTISLMVSNKNVTTFSPQMKTYYENICLHIISVCDHRVKNFILRCSSDAAKTYYQELLVSYEKYHKFKGKV